MDHPDSAGGGRRGVALALLAILVAAACATAPQRPPNIVFIVIDTLRQDHLGCYGWRRDTSPEIDALAAEAIRFDRAYAASPWTLPSVASMLTGLYPSSHGATRLQTRLPEKVDTLAEILRSAGYRTAGVVSHTILTKRWNFQQGYDIYLQSEARGHDHVSTPGVTRQARAALRNLAESGAPFFLFVHYFDPHYEYKRHPGIGFAPPSAGRLDGSEPIAELRGMLDDLRPEEIDFIVSLYDEEIRFTDEGIRQLLRALKQAGLYDDSVLIVTADHGEEFLAHGWLGHTRTLYEELIKVPLILRLPGNRHGGRIVSEPVSQVSLAPTILELAGVGSPRVRFHGPSLLPLISTGRGDGRAVVFSEVDFIPLTKAYAYKTTHKKAIATRRFKLIRDDTSGRHELYDLETDPLEALDLAPSRPALVRDLAPLLDRTVALARGAVAEAEEIRLSEEQIERLRSLGYVGR